MPFDGSSFNASSFVVDLMISNLSDPSRWTKGRMRQFEPNAPDRMCMLGALKIAMADASIRNHGLARTIKNTIAGVIDDAATGDDYMLARRLSWAFPGALIMQFNDDDNVSHGDVMTVLRMTRQRLL